MAIVITRSEALSSLKELEDEQFPDGEEYDIPNYESMTNSKLREELCLSGTYHDTVLGAVVDDSKCKRRQAGTEDLSTEGIRVKIPSWTTDEEIELIRNVRIWHKFDDPPISFEDLLKIMRNPKNWKRFSKFKKAAVIERALVCKPLDETLWLRVISDLSDKKIMNYYFRAE